MKFVKFFGTPFLTEHLTGGSFFSSWNSHLNNPFLQKADAWLRSKLFLICYNAKLSTKWYSFLRQPPEVFYVKSVLRNFTKFTGLRPATLLKKRLWRRCFPVNFANILITPFFTEHLWTSASELWRLSCRLVYQSLNITITETKIDKISNENNFLLIFSFLT